jgi:hypothetical protein
MICFYPGVARSLGGEGHHLRGCDEIWEGVGGQQFLCLIHLQSANFFFSDCRWKQGMP